MKETLSYCPENSDTSSESSQTVPQTTGETAMSEAYPPLAESETVGNVLSAKQSEVGNSLPLEKSTVPLTAPDPFDPASLRMSPENSGVSIRKIITNIPCQKPAKQAFVRTRT